MLIFKRNFQMVRIILIGGTAGTGKTTLAREICNELKLSHRLGTGFIREILRSYLDRDKFKELFTYTFRPDSQNDLINNFELQSKIICKAINDVIKRAHNEGTSIVIEGNHLLPKFIDMKYVTDFYILSIPNELIKKRLSGNTHSKRKITKQDFSNVLELQSYILDVANKENISILINNKLHGSVVEVCNKNEIH